MNGNRQQIVTQVEQLVAALEGMAGVLRGTVESGVLQAPADDDSARPMEAAEAAKLLGISPAWLYKHAAQLPFAIRAGRAVRFDRVGLLEWKRKQNETRRPSVPAEVP